MKKIIYSLFCCLHISYTLCEKVLIKIDHIVRELDDSISIETECDIKEWENQLSNACKCCLFKSVPKIGSGPGQKTVEQIVEECNKKYCTPELIKSFRESAPDFTTTLYHLYNNAVVIKKISKKGIAFDEKGNLTEEGVKTFLEKAYKEGKLPYEDFKSVTCIQVRDIRTEVMGLASTQLFLITSTCGAEQSSYILKEAERAGQTEVKLLEKSFEIKELDDLILPNHIKGYPSLAIPFTYLQYNNHYLYLLPKAPGVEFRILLSDYFLNPTEEKKKNLEQACFDVGFAMSKFHQRFMKSDIVEHTKKFGKLISYHKTLLHGDFNPRNIFYDITTHQVTLIDNETLHFGYALEDIFTLFDALPFMAWENKESLLELATAPIIEGYISGYPKTNWSVVFNELAPIVESSQFKNILGKQFTIVKQNIASGKFEITQLKNSLVKLTNSLSAIIKFLSIN